MDVGICLTQVAPICSMRGWRKNTPEFDRAGVELQHRGSVSGIPGPAAMAGGFSLPTMRSWPFVARARSAVGVHGLRLPNFGYSGNDLPGYADAFADLVPRHVVGNDAEERRERVGTATSAGAKKL